MAVADESLSLIIGAIILFCFVSLLGFFGPIYMKYSRGVNNLQDDVYFLLLKSFASGTILSVALLHLLGESVNDLLLYTEYPLALALAMAGIIITLGLDQVTMLLIYEKSMVIVSDFNSNNERGSEVNSYQNSAMEKLTQLQTDETSVASNRQNLNQNVVHDHEKEQVNEHNNDSSSSSSSSFIDRNNNLFNGSITYDEFSEFPLKTELEVVGHDDSHAHDHKHSHSMLLITDKNARKAFVKTLVLETSIAIHSIIIGVSFGGLGADSIGTIKVLTAALSFHQFFEGISLGSAIAESNLQFPTVCFFAFIFAFSFTTGAVIGIFTAGPNETGVLVQGCFNAFAAGSLIYSALVEMMAEDFSSSELNDRVWLKAAMYGFLILGCLGMAVLAIYA